MDTTVAQEKITYQKPPKEILELVDVPHAPAVKMDSEGKYMVFLYRDAHKSLAELSEEEMRLGGLRINPKAYISSRITYFKDIQVKKTLEGEPQQVKGLPEEGRMAHFTWSPDETKIAFTNTTEDKTSLWVLDMEKVQAHPVGSLKLNANMGNPLRWFQDSASLMVKSVPNDRKELIDTKERVPTGPTVSSSSGGKAQNRTYQDLLKNPADEHNFEQLTRSELCRIGLDGQWESWADPAMYSNMDFSPDGRYVIISQIEHPFSYLVPYQRFPFKTTLFTKEGKEWALANEVPLSEELPQGFMAVRLGRRHMGWRSDRPATLVWTEALDHGDPEQEADHRDEVFEWEAPFQGKPKSILKTINRYGWIQWGNDSVAIAHDYWWNTRNTKVYRFNPSEPSEKPQVLFDRNYQDRYGDPGDFAMTKNHHAKDVLNINQGAAYLIGSGHTEEGQFPFIDRLDFDTNQTERLYQSGHTDRQERILRLLDIAKGECLVSLESPTDYPNYYKRNIGEKGGTLQLTDFKNPFFSLQEVHKEVIKYQRADGLELSGTLYLPLGYDRDKKKKSPMILWAYPMEFKNKDSAGQITANPNSFIYPFYGSVIYWVTRGYVVLDGASFPIVGEGEEEPNDTFIPQLLSNAKAAIDAVDALGYIDRDRVAVGGHSYGAFMTANLLSHSDMFAAGIARSGAYNRTLTPFGFQSEERNFWEAPEVYHSMSPFTHADKMKTPLLLVHGEADNNAGTYPLQSERYFNALKGFGATTRLVILPKESHSYAAKESILHLLWEQDQWLEKYVKNKKKAEK